MTHNQRLEFQWSLLSTLFSEQFLQRVQCVSCLLADYFCSVVISYIISCLSIFLLSLTFATTIRCIWLKRPDIVISPRDLVSLCAQQHKRETANLVYVSNLQNWIFDNPRNGVCLSVWQTITVESALEALRLCAI